MDAKQQARNLTHMFRLYDSSASGDVGWNDYQTIIDRLAAGKPELRSSLEGAFRADWRQLAEAADVDESGRVSLDEWLAYHSAAVESERGFEVAVTSILLLVIAIADPDGDGRISASDYAVLGPAFGIGDPADVAAAIDRLDTDGDGIIEADEIRRAAASFFRPTGPDDPGNWLLGPVR